MCVVEGIQDFESHGQMEQEDTCLHRVEDNLLEVDNRFVVDTHFEVDMGYFALVVEILPDTFCLFSFTLLYD